MTAWDGARVVTALAFVALLVIVLQKADLPSAVALLRRAPALWLALVPASLGVLCDIFGWNKRQCNKHFCLHTYFFHRCILIRQTKILYFSP